MKKLHCSVESKIIVKNVTVKKILYRIGIFLLLSIFCTAATSMAAKEYDAADVDSPPKIVKQMPVKYPSSAKKNGVTGKVVIRCLIGTDGKAGKFEIVESEPAGIFDESAMSTLKYWQFRPGIKGGELVATWVKVPFKFE